MLKEFREFVLRGNVLDLAVAVIFGGVFGKIVSSLVNDILMPPIGLALGKVDFGNLYLSLSGRSYASLSEAKAAGAPTLNYGIFINAVIDFLIVALVLFLLVRAFNRMQRQQAAAPEKPGTKPCPFCFSHIPLAATRCAHCTATITTG